MFIDIMNNKENNENICSMIIKAHVIKNALEMNWSVEKISDKQFVLRKSLTNISEDERNTEILLSMLFNVSVFDVETIIEQ
jgi:hypothetical protein